MMQTYFRSESHYLAIHIIIVTFAMCITVYYVSNLLFTMWYSNLIHIKGAIASSHEN